MRSPRLPISLISVGLGVVATLLYSIQLGAQSLWLDEGSTWAEVTGRTGKGWGQLLAELVSPSSAYPLYHLLLRAWTAIAGDSEWALRFPSAVAAAVAVCLIWDSCRWLSRTTPWMLLPLLLSTPFLVWHAQDAKVYSFLIAIIAGIVWASIRALHTNRWWLVIGLTLSALFVHRLALLAVAGVLFGLIWHPPLSRYRLGLLVGAGLTLATGMAGLLFAGAESRFGAEPGVSPLQTLSVTMANFATGRGLLGGWLGIPLWLWLMPSLGLTALGMWHFIRQSHPQRTIAAVILSTWLVPLIGLAVVVAINPIYQSRYAAVGFAGWMLVVSAALALSQGRLRWLANGLATLTIIVQLMALFQPVQGQFSGAPVKEQWREAIRDLSRRLHPDDLLILHPYYVKPMWEYYAPRVTPDPLPAPIEFTGFGEGFAFEQLSDQQAIRDRFRREYEQVFNQAAFGKKRMLILIAPDHARSIDPPLPGDRYGWLGLRFQFPQNTWPCGGTGDGFIGVEVMCQSFPETYNAAGPGQIPEPTTRIEAVFGGIIKLRGISITPAGGALRPGGTLPITLYWEASQPIERNYTMFLHLCQECDQPPLAQTDQPPLGGYAPAGLTSTWQIGDPVHDERSIPLPANLPPGRYTLLLGIYPAGELAAEQRLSIVSTAPVLANGRLVLGQIVVER